MRYSFTRRSGTTRLAANPLLVAAVISLMGVIVRLSLLSVPGHLGGLTEYDDGVYFGAALKLVNGVFPYKDYVLVQPPGIALLLSPVALLAKFIGSDGGLSVARIVTVLVDGLNIFLVGKIVRSRGIVAVLAGCGFMAFYSQAIVSSATVLLEPYMNLFCLLDSINRETSSLTTHAPFGITPCAKREGTGAGAAFISNTKSATNTSK